MFNRDSRTNNAAKASFWGITCNIANTLFGFGYRTIFLYVLSANYLGINGLFTNILQILSFADLGISNAIVFRLYKPISQNDTYKVGQLMYFFKSVYRCIALIVFFVGLAFLPFLSFFIKDTGEIPSDVNLIIVYVLFLFQTVSSYLFVYKQIILNADQKQYISSLINSAIVLLRYILQIIVLVITKKYVFVLSVSIIWTVLSNYIFSRWVQNKYKDVFDVSTNISALEKKQIFDDTKATLCHKIGGTVLTSTDSIVISKFVGLISTGFYSNYSLVFSSLTTILNQLFGSFTSSLGNAHVEQSLEQKYTSYKRLLFANLWMTSLCTICLFSLINDFISIWVGKKMLLSMLTVSTLSIQFFVETSRIISQSYTNGCGLFVKDKIRPLIEASINIIVSVIMVKEIGIAGVFIGTIISHLLTVSWREPYLLYKYEFKRSIAKYWVCYIKAFIGTVIFCSVYSLVFNLLDFKVTNFVIWLIKALCIFSLTNIIIVLIYHKDENYQFYKNLIKNRVLHIMKKA